MEPAKAQYQDLLIHELEVRQNKNPAYSLRAYARDLDISPSNLSRILNGQQELSLGKAAYIAKVLGLNESESEYFFALIQTKVARSPKAIEAAKEKLLTTEMAGAEISLEYFKTIADWHYFALIELTAVEDFRSDPDWIAKRMGLTQPAVVESIARLKKLELIEEDEAGNLKKTADFRRTPSGVPSRAIKLHHQQILKKAETALFERELSETDFSSTAFTLCSEDLIWAKEEIKKFRRELTKRLARAPKRDRLYELAIHLFPLDQIEAGKKPTQKKENKR